MSVPNRRNVHSLGRKSLHFGPRNQPTCQDESHNDSRKPASPTSTRIPNEYFLIQFYCSKDQMQCSGKPEENLLGEKAIQAGELRQAYVSNSRFEHSQAIYTTDLSAAKEAMATEKDRKLALDLVGRRKAAWKQTIKRIRVKQEVRLRHQQVAREATKVSQAQGLDFTPLQETQKCHSSIKM